MECTICKKKLTAAEKPVAFDVHEDQPDGEIGTGFRLYFCPPTLEGNPCETKFRELTEKRNLVMVPVQPDGE